MIKFPVMWEQWILGLRYRGGEGRLFLGKFSIKWDLSKLPGPWSLLNLFTPALDRTDIQPTKVKAICAVTKSRI